MPNAFRHWSCMVAAAVLCAVGCDVYDEPVQPAAERSGTAAWPGLVDGQRPYGLASARSSGIEYVEGYEDALARAHAEQKPLLVLFRANWCRWCGEMAGKVLSEQQVVQRSRRFVCVAVDADRDRAICRDHDIRGYPTILLLSPDGRELDRRTGKLSPKALLAMLDEVEAAVPTSLATPATKTVR